jgi:hypothetical protein
MVRRREDAVSNHEASSFETREDALLRMREATGVASHSVVIARLDRATQYSVAVEINLKGHGVLDHPLSRVMTSCCVARLWV